MKVYLYTISLVLFLLASFGFILPFLFSAAHTELVIGGVVFACSTPIVCYYWILKICKLNKLELGEEEV